MTTTPSSIDDNHISSVSRMLIDQMRDLRNARTPEALRDETERAKSMALLAQASTGVARVEADYATKTGSDIVPFLEPSPAHLPPSTHTSQGRTQHRIR